MYTSASRVRITAVILIKIALLTLRVKNDQPKQFKLTFLVVQASYLDDEQSIWSRN